MKEGKHEPINFSEKMRHCFIFLTINACSLPAQQSQAPTAKPMSQSQRQNKAPTPEIIAPMQSADLHSSESLCAAEGWYLAVACGTKIRKSHLKRKGN